jgi:tRNA dimethylallyltransferase
LCPLIAIAGPTGSGKSALALHLASRFRAEIISCDSVQLYRHFNIGTAKLSREEQRGVPHHLIDILDPDDPFTAGDYARLARRTAREIAGRNNIPIVAGGTGFYLRAMLDGLFEGPVRDDRIRVRLAAREARRQGSLHRILRRLDAAAASRIHPNDKNKLIRAIEVCLLARRPVSELYASGSRPLVGFTSCLIGLDPPRRELYRLLDARCGAMWESGLADEVRAILALGYTGNEKPFQSLGYQQVLQELRGELSRAEALEEMRKQTRRYAKRQWTWFKKDTRVSWIPGFGHHPSVRQRAEETLLNSHPSLIAYLL